MVILTIITDENDHTVHFKEPLGKSQYMRLLNCSLYTSWYNLKRAGEIMIFDERDNAKVKRIPAGNYSIETLGKALETVFKGEKINLRFDDAEGAIVIENPFLKKVQIDRDLTALLGLIKFNLTERGRKLKNKTIINQLTSFNTYLIHCDLIDREENLLNGEFSDVLSSFDIKGKPFERVTYQSEETAMRKMKKSQITSMKIRVTDENNDLINFNGLPLRFEIEII